MKKLSVKATRRNRKTVLYCTECCTYFKLNDSEEWINAGSSNKKAEVINGSFIQCSCGNNVGVVAKKNSYLVGEVIPVN